jgi:hypothetical protein
VSSEPTCGRRHSMRYNMSGQGDTDARRISPILNAVL